MLADAMGLYYNEDMLKKAGLNGPPKTISELTQYAKKLTVRAHKFSGKAAEKIAAAGGAAETIGGA